MKKIFKALICAGLAGALAAGTLGAAACKKSGGTRDPEKSPLRLAIGACDEKFNPLYYTSLNDGTIANMTQVSLITADKDGKLVVGENQPTVALDYKETYYNKSGDVLATGDGQTVTPATTGDPEGSTTYEFLIKNGMKFSDGVDLTVMDVLFNLYVYLDPLYSGSSTIYSTKIKGLQAYRQNNENAGEDDIVTNSAYYIAAQKRVDDLIKWSSGETTTYVQDDLDKVKKLYKDALTSEWNSISTGWAEQYKDYYFTETWQAFYFSVGVFDEQKKLNDNGVEVRVEDENGKYPTEIDPDVDTGVISSRGQGIIDDMAAVATDAKIDEYIAQYPGMDREVAKLALHKAHAIEYAYNSNTMDTNIKNLLYEGSLYSAAVDEFVKDEMTKETEDVVQTVKKIAGITVSHTADSKHNGTFNGKTYEEDHDILKIEIVGVDPKAKWNFGFTVAPMHYYSGSYGGVNYVEKAMTDYENGWIYEDNENNDKATNFGVKYRDVNFTNNVLAASSKNGVPKGAGAYRCCTYNYSSSGVSAGTFFYSNMAFFERNPYFETMGEGIENAKIKYVTYKVTNDDQIVNSLKTGEIDYGEPVAKSDNQAACSSMAQITYQTGGYGYVGINPKYVPDIEIRQAIMMAFDTSLLFDYYGEALVNVINRPMTNTTWVWDYVDHAKDPYYEPATDAEAIKTYIERNGGWRYEGGTWKHNDGRTGLKFTFTIAGESTDHPAWDMFTDAQRTLEEVGFDISVGTDIKALQKMVTGDLAVWAAAWSSSIDPDPYQIYSIYSNASSTKNWHKDGIISNPTKYSKEYEIATELNKRIIAGRQTLDLRERSEIYAKSTGEELTELSALDLIMELAVEFPTYQRYDLCVFNGNVLDKSTMHVDDATHNMGPLGEMWKVNYVK